MNICPNTNFIDVSFFEYSEKEATDAVSRGKQVVEQIRKSTFKKHMITVSGFELFHDGVGVHTFLTYMAFFDIISIACKALEVEFQVVWVTNMTFRENREMVSWLLAKTHRLTKLKTYYRFIGGGMSLTDRMAFQSNLLTYKDSISTVAISMNAPSTRKILADNDTFFKEYLYGEYPLVYEHYSVEKPEKKMIARDEDVLASISFLNEKYPLIKSL